MRSSFINSRILLSLLFVLGYSLESASMLFSSLFLFSYLSVSCSNVIYIDGNANLIITI